MQVVQYDDLIDVRASRGIVKDFSQPIAGQIQEPPSDYQVMLDMITVDPVCWTSVDLTTDMVTYKGYDFIGDSEERIKEAKKRFENELDFDQEIRGVIFQMIVYGDSYLEVGDENWTTGKYATELHQLETTEMALEYGKHGIITSYRQKEKNKSKEMIGDMNEM